MKVAMRLLVIIKRLFLSRSQRDRFHPVIPQNYTEKCTLNHEFMVFYLTLMTVRKEASVKLKSEYDQSRVGLGLRKTVDISTVPFD